jgi:PIN domain nuclease of toxin-antitoxin system
MTYLLDTHVLYWHLFDPTRLSHASRRAIDDGEAGKGSLIVLSLVLAELYYLLRKAQVEDLLPDVVGDLQDNPNYRIEPITLEDVLKLAAYPEVPEMHDRLIVAAGSRLAATLITKDQKIQASPQVTWLW